MAIAAMTEVVGSGTTVIVIAVADMVRSHARLPLSTGFVTVANSRQSCPYSLAIQTIRFTSRGSSSATLAVRRCVFLACPSTRHARRSVTSSRPSVSRACSTA